MEAYRRLPIFRVRAVSSNARRDLPAIAGFVLTKIACHCGDSECFPHDSSAGGKAIGDVAHASHEPLPAMWPVCASKYHCVVNPKLRENSEVAEKRLPRRIRTENLLVDSGSRLAEGSAS